MGGVTSKLVKSGSNTQVNIDLTGGTQVCVPGTRQECHRARHEKILDGYENFNTYVFIGSLRDTTNCGRLNVQRHVITLEASRVVSRLSQNCKEYDSIINPLCTIYIQILRTTFHE